MGLSSDSISVLRDSIRDGSFPDSDRLLTADITTEDIPHLLQSLAEGRDSLSRQIRDISKDQVEDVDEWIAQAEKVQADIARCKIEARQIVEEHERTEAIRQGAREASNQVQLLEAEIAFTRSLEHELQVIEEISQVLEEIERHMSRAEYNLSVDKLNSIKISTTNLTASQPRTLLLQLQRVLHRKLQQQILEALAELWIVHQDQIQVSMEIRGNGPPGNGPQEETSNPGTAELLQALTELSAISHAATLFIRKLEAFVLPVFSSKSNRFPSNTVPKDGRFVIVFAKERPNSESVVDIFQALVQFLHENIPDAIREDVAAQFLPGNVTLFISKWLDTAIPYELDQLPGLETLKQRVIQSKSALLQYSWPGASQLDNWINQIPDTWLAKRQTRSLEAVRQSFTRAQNIKRQVERVERQIVGHKEKAAVSAQDVTDDWGAEWDADPSQEQIASAALEEKDEDNTSGWDLDIEDDQPEAELKEESNKPEDHADDAGDAWGWGDELPSEVKKEPPTPSPQKSKREKTAPPSDQEMVLTELYTITDIPDHILETVGRDLFDSETLKSNPKRYFDSPILGHKLQSSPGLVLAMYRAIAPTHYSHSPTLTNMHLYNDTSYIAQTLSNNSDSSLHPPIESLHKFARQTYTRELDTQRTILTDLLDGAQGFESCSEQPYKRECEIAVAAVTDHIRSIHAQWQPILGPSHLLQSIGSLVTMVRGKMIRDILDMEDITEAQGTQLISLCTKISALDSLFTSIPTTDHTANTTVPDDQETTTTAPLYIPSYFRFSYLTQILESNLVEIRYLWTEGELSLEFSADEVVELIRALFAESQKRREAIAEVKRGR